MEPVWLAVGVLFAVGFTLLLVTAVGFSWYMVLQMRKLQQSADASTKVMQEVMGDGSISSLSKSSRALVAMMPDALEVVKMFNQSMSAFTKAVFSEETPKARSAATPGEEGEFYAYSEEEAAQQEVIQRHRKEKTVLSDEQLRGMRTEPKTKVPEDKLPPKPAEDTSSLTQTAL